MIFEDSNLIDIISIYHLLQVIHVMTIMATLLISVLILGLHPTNERRR